MPQEVSVRGRSQRPNVTGLATANQRGGMKAGV